MDSEEIEFLSMNNAVLHNQIKQLTAERDTYKQALDDLGVTPTEAKAGVARSKALLAERDALKAALENAVGALAVIHNGGAMYALTPNEYMRCVEALAKVK